MVLQKEPVQLHWLVGHEDDEPYLAHDDVQTSLDTFIMQFGSALQPFKSRPYKSLHVLEQVPANVQSQPAAKHSVFVPHREHWNTQEEPLHWHHPGRVAQLVDELNGHGLAMQVWLPRYHWQVGSLSHDAESLHWHGGRWQEPVEPFQMQPPAAQLELEVSMQRRGPHDEVLENHSHEASLLQSSRVPYRYGQVSMHVLFTTAHCWYCEQRSSELTEQRCKQSDNCGIQLHCDCAEHSV